MNTPNHQPDSETAGATNSHTERISLTLSIQPALTLEAMDKDGETVIIPSVAWGMVHDGKTTYHYQPIRASDHYLPVIAIYPNGAEVRTSTLKGREHYMDKAIEELTAGRHASVPLDEAERVRTWLLNHKANL